MDSDLDPFDDLPLRPAARAGKKFQPKAKPRPRTIPSAIPDATEEKAAILLSTGLEITNEKSVGEKLADPIDISLRSSNLFVPKEPLKNIEYSSFRVPKIDQCRNSELVEPSGVVVTSFDDSHHLGLGISAWKAEPSTVTPIDSVMSQSIQHADDAGDRSTPAVDSCLANSEVMGFTEQEGNEDSPFSDKRSADHSSELHALKQDVVSDAQHPENAVSGSNGDHQPCFETSAGELVTYFDPLGSDLDPFNDILPQPSTNNSRAVKKFPPRVNPHPRKEISPLDNSGLPNVTKEHIASSVFKGSSTKESIVNDDVAVGHGYPHLTFERSIRETFFWGWNIRMISFCRL